MGGAGAVYAEADAASRPGVEQRPVDHDHERVPRLRDGERSDIVEQLVGSEGNDVEVGRVGAGFDSYENGGEGVEMLEAPARRRLDGTTRGNGRWRGHLCDSHFLERRRGRAVARGTSPAAGCDGGFTATDLRAFSTVEIVGDHLERPQEPVLSRLVEHARAAAADHDRHALANYLRHYYAHVDVEDLTARRIEDLFGAAMDHLRLALDWQPGSTTVKAVNPKIHVDGWESDHTLVMVVTDDLPFLVDSAIMEISRLELGIHLVVHPVVRDKRSDAGLFEDPRTTPTHDGSLASLMMIEVDRQADDGRLDAIEREIARVLADVRASVADWRPMQTRMRELAAGLADEHLPVDDFEIAEARELLEWFADDHFTFLGYREYDVETRDGEEALVVRADTGLGILRAPPVEEVRPIADMPSGTRERIHERRLLNLTKASTKATVHRAAYMDYVGVKRFDEAGAVVGERRFIGLFSAEAYSRSVTQIPKISRIVSEVVDRAGFPPGGHDEKRLMTILETYPRDELFQMSTDEVYDAALAIAGLQERRRLRLFTRVEIFGRFVTCLVYLPRDRYNTSSRRAISELLTDAYAGSLAEWNASLSESVLARLYFLVRVGDVEADDVDTDALERRIAAIIQDWSDDFGEELVHLFGEDLGVGLGRRYQNAFPAGYRAVFDPRSAAADAAEIESLTDDGAPRINAYREPGHPSNTFKLKLFRRGDRVSLTHVMPILSNLGVTVLDERTFEVLPEEGESVWVYDFALEHDGHDREFAEAAELVERTFSAVWADEVADDAFNRLVLAAGLDPAEVGVLRAYARYLIQTSSPYSQLYIEDTLSEHSDVARALVDLFIALFSLDGPERDAAIRDSRARIDSGLEQVASLDQDRIIQTMRNLIESTLRTSYFQRDEHGQPRPYLAFKLNPQKIIDLPEPRPQFEIFAYSPRFEGVHLRSGPVARGGLRWSDRNEDYRTEVLGLVKAQMVKNAVIVPAGAKGGFVLKRRPFDRAELQAEVVACYQLFVGALLDLSDNLVDGEIVPPVATLRRDGDDPYLVVAADKGTATFSDIANGLALERGFWLGDAFASGGSNGYDHKGMGITARGAWESVKRHFRELGVDVQSEEFTAVGIGDMSGDVFGNGMLRSSHLKLIAAFDHRHVFVDPDPDPVTSFAERQRLFEMGRSTWDDYDRSLLSDGGFIVERAAKSVEPTPEARRALGIERSGRMTPDQLISAVLRAPVDLLWNGGIGTYVKAQTETHLEVGDKANDGIRVDGRDLRCRVVGEGGNLGFTQHGRIEFAQRDGRVYTDAIDNSAGVDCSDHEVNIKILLDRIVAEGDLTAKQRSELLEEMTDEVAELVLANNYSQTQALGTERVETASMAEVHARYIAALEGQGLIDRSLECLPDAEAIADRRLAGTGLTTPELAVLLAYTKNILQAELLDSDVPDDPYFLDQLQLYFPEPIRQRFSDRIGGHSLHREIISSQIVNQVVDRAGTTMLFRLGLETSAPMAEIAAAHMAVWEIYQLGELADEVNALDNELSAEEQILIHLRARQLAERATRLLVRSRPYPFSAAAAIGDLAEPVRATTARIDEFLVGADKVAFDSRVDEHTAAGAPVELARRAAGLGPAIAAIDIVDVATEASEEIDGVAGVYFEVAERLELTWLRDRILALPRNSQWETLARLTLRGDLHSDHRELVRRVVAHGATGTPIERVDAWGAAHELPVSFYRQTISDIRATASGDLTSLLVASREVRGLIGRT